MADTPRPRRPRKRKSTINKPELSADSTIQRQAAIDERASAETAKRGMENLPTSPGANAGPFDEVGVSGLTAYSGYVDEEFLTSLMGVQGRQTFREMADNDATIGAILRMFELLIRGVDWDVVPATNDPAGDEAAEFVRTVMDDMSHTWGDFLSEALTMLPYGWAYHEIAWKRRTGPEQADPTRRSKYTDGKIGVRKLAPRAQTSLARWNFQEDGGLLGMEQTPPTGGETVFIPIEKALLFRTTSRRNNPEGKSILRNAYVPWYYLKTVQSIEAIGIERELNGFPVIRIPKKYLSSDAAADVAIRAKYEKIARDIKFNSQGGLLAPSDLYRSDDGKPVPGAYEVVIELLTSGGQRAIDTNKVALRYQKDIARSVLADFIMLGAESVGSFALADSKTDLFYSAVDAVVDQIVEPVNRHLLPRLWDINGMDRQTMPQIRAASVEPEDLGELGEFVRNVASSGLILPDAELENDLRGRADLPISEMTEDA